MKLHRIAPLLLVALGFTGVANADSIVESWQCKLEEGKTTEDVQAINSRWLKWARENVSEDIASAVGTTIVGDTTIFIFVDTYPDLETWAKAKKAFDESDEIDEMFEDVSECSSNRLWKLEDTK